MQQLRKAAGLIAVALLAYAAGSVSAPIQGQTADTAGAPSVVTPKILTPPAHYILGPNDEIVIFASHADDLNGKSVRISPTGEISLAQIGRVHVAGMTVDELQAELTERLKVFIKQPDVVVNITQFKSQPVSVLGEVGSPGIVQLEGRKNLIEVLALAGGTKPSAGSRIRITRRLDAGPIPLASAKSEGDYSVADVNVSSIGDGSRPTDNILIQPNDIISVSKADIVYVIGVVGTPGGFALNDRKSISVIEALARAGGTGPLAKKSHAQLIRHVPGEDLLTIPVDIDKVLKNKATNLMMQPDDILYIPDNYAKGLARRTGESILQMATGMAIYRY